MHNAPSSPLHVRRAAAAPRGFTLIELLAVIAIIAVLAAILFPVAGTVREQARAGDCMTKLHQLWLSSNVYKEDEGTFPMALQGLVEVAVVDASGNCRREQSTGVFYDGTNAPTVGGLPCVTKANATLRSGFLYPELIKDAVSFHCPDNTVVDPGRITTALFPARPARWADKAGTTPYIGDTLAAFCGTGAGGLTIDCFTAQEVGATSPLLGRPKYYYPYNSYDVGPAVTVEGAKVSPQTFLRRYSRDWTGVRGYYDSADPAKVDLANQLKYKNPPPDRTILTFCTWHAYSANTGTAPAISMSGSAKKINLRQLVDYGPMTFAP